MTTRHAHHRILAISLGFWPFLLLGLFWGTLGPFLGQSIFWGCFRFFRATSLRMLVAVVAMVLIFGAPLLTMLAVAVALLRERAS
jgi:hypothetical protein